MNKIIDINPDRRTIARFRKLITGWGQKNFRHFPWRETSNPYHILIAEVMLHRTQARQVESIFRKFVSKYPDIQSLNLASETDLEEDLHSLGLHWRIGLVKNMAAEIACNHNGIIPEFRSELMSLPGVGEYITSAVRCFAYGKSDPIVDTNIMRIITRVFDIQFKDSLRRNKTFITFAENLVDPEEPARYHYGILDLAALVCKPKSPICAECPLSVMCAFYQHSADESYTP